MLHRYFFYVLIFLLKGIQISGQGDSPPDSIRVSILTCAPGDQLYSMYGHNAIRVRDNAIGTDLVFNYGTFDFNTPGFAIKFMRGKLPYLLSVARYDDFIYEYTYFQRDVMEQELALSQEQKSGIISFLDENMRPENRAYAYDFFQDNCATRLRLISSGSEIAEAVTFWYTGQIGLLNTVASIAAANSSRAGSISG